MEECRSARYAIAVSTAGCAPKYVKNFLQTRIDRIAFTPAMLASPAFQACKKNKTAGLRTILGHFQADSKCSVLLDNELPPPPPPAPRISFPLSVAPHITQSELSLHIPYRRQQPARGVTIKAMRIRSE